MKIVITAIGNPLINNKLKEEKEIEIIGRDIQYKEGIIEILEKNKNINYVIINENLPGQIEFKYLIEKIKIINKKIKIIFYDKNDNFEKIKNKLKINKKIKNKSEKNKKFNFEKRNIITIFGDRKVGKSTIIILILGYIITNLDSNYKLLIIDQNQLNPSFWRFYYELNNKKIKIKNKKKIKKGFLEKNKCFFCKNLNKKIIEKNILKINKNINIFLYDEKIKEKNIKNNKNFKKIIKNYNYILIEKDFSEINNNLNKNSENILIINPSLLEIKNNVELIEKRKIKNFKILINKNNKYSIDEKIMENIFNKNKIIGKINYNLEYEKIINYNLKNIFLNKKRFFKEIENIKNKII